MTRENPATPPRDLDAPRPRRFRRAVKTLAALTLAAAALWLWDTVGDLRRRATGSVFWGVRYRVMEYARQHGAFPPTLDAAYADAGVDPNMDLDALTYLVADRPHQEPSGRSIPLFHEKEKHLLGWRRGQWFLWHDREAWISGPLPDDFFHPLSEAIPMEPLPGAVADWHGFKKHDFAVDGVPAVVVRPDTDAVPDGRPWLWRARFFGAFPSADLALLEKGWHVAHINIDELYGAPESNRRFDLLYAFMTARGFSPRPLLAGFSRGGLDVLSWASRHPERVGGLYLDNAVCDFASWPGGRGAGPGSAEAWKNCLAAWKLSEDEALARTPDIVYDPAPLARAGIPLLLLVAEDDEVVPAAENSDLLAARYRALGGTVREIRKPGAQHHPHSLDDPAPIVAFAENR